MEEKLLNGIAFIDNLADYDLRGNASRVLHILCTAGAMSFSFQDRLWNISPKDYVILPNSGLVSSLAVSDDFKGLAFSLSGDFVGRCTFRSEYGIVGHLALLQNPVMKLGPEDFQICMESLEFLKRRLGDKKHLFQEELLEKLMSAHILDLYDIHARTAEKANVSKRQAQLLQKFIGMLHSGEYRKNRSLEFYADKLCVTPQYLSEVCRKVSGRPASFWIDRFTVQEIAALLKEKKLPLKEIVERLSFSSVSYFTRYVLKHLKMTPSEYRNGF